MFKIMVVEDDKTIRNLIIEIITKWGFKEVSVSDFNEVLNVFSKESPHLVLMDINLPVFDGYYWCNKIREISKVPIVFISSRDTNMDIIMGMNMGGDDYINKPFQAEVLMAKVNAILRRSYNYVNLNFQVIEHKNLILNTTENTLMMKDTKIELTKNEFKILQILMKNKGNIVSRDKIMRELWEDEKFVDDNTLTVNITRIRKKLEDIGLNDFITTKKGQGYVIL